MKFGCIILIQYISPILKIALEISRNILVLYIAIFVIAYLDVIKLYNDLGTIAWGFFLWHPQHNRQYGSSYDRHRCLTVLQCLTIKSQKLLLDVHQKF